MRRSAARSAHIIIVVVLVVFAAGASSAAAAATELISLVGPSSQEASAAGDTTLLRFPIEIAAGVSAKTLTVSISSVSREDGQSAAASYGAFSVALTPPAAQAEPELVVDIKLSPVVTPAHYDLVLSVRSSSDPTKRQLLPLTVVIPAAALRPPATLVIEQTTGFFGKNASIELPPLLLHETSRRSRLTDVTVEQVDTTRNGTGATAATLVVKKTVTVPAGGVSQQPYTLDGNFGLGTATGTLEIDAPQLAAPVAFAYEVHTRRHWGYLILAAALGVLAGVLVRVVFKAAVARAQALREGAALLSQIQQQLPSLEDEKVAGDLEEKRAALASSLHWGKTTKTIQDATKAAADSLAAALTALTQNRQAAQTKQASQATLLAHGWSLPASVRTLLSDAADLSDAAAAALAQDQVNQAQELQKKVEEACQKAVDAARTWKKAALQSLKTLDLAKAPPDNLAGMIKDATSAARAALEAISEDAGADATSVLNQTHAAVTSFSDLYVALAPVSAEVDTIVQTLKAAGAKTDEIERRYVEFAAALRSIDTIGDLGTHFSALLTALESTIRTLAEAAHQNVDADLTAGRYVQAAKTAAAPAAQSRERDIAAALARGEAVSEGAAPGAVSRELRALWAGIPSSQTFAARAGTIVVGARQTASPPVSEAASVLALIGIEILQGLVLLLIAVGLAYALFAHNFVGTAQDLAEVFFWGFAIDLTGSALTDAAKGLRPTTPAAA